MPGRAVERKIFFYRALVGTDDGLEPLAFDADAALSKIDSLKFVRDVPDSRYLIRSDQDGVCSWPHLGPSPPRAVFASIRWDAWPQVDRDGELGPLRVRQGAGLAESVHVVFFPGNIVGAEYNHYGPRMGSVAEYISEKVGAQVEILPLLREDVLSQFDQMRSIRILDLKVHASFISQVKNADESLGAAFESMQETSGAEELQLVLAPLRYSRRSLSSRLKEGVRRLLRTRDLEHGVRRFVLRGPSKGSDEMMEINVLRSKMMSTKRIMRSDAQSRALVAMSAWDAIIEAYEELRPQLEEAPVLG